MVYAMFIQFILFSFIAYEVLEKSGRKSDTFAFDQDGCLQLLKKVNHENNDRHSLTLRAFNPDADIPQESTTEIIINVMDVNEAPVYIRYSSLSDDSLISMNNVEYSDLIRLQFQMRMIKVQSAPQSVKLSSTTVTMAHVTTTYSTQSTILTSFSALINLPVNLLLINHSIVKHNVLLHQTGTANTEFKSLLPIHVPMIMYKPIAPAPDSVALTKSR